MTDQYPIDAVIGDINHFTQGLCPGDRRMHLENLYVRALAGTMVDAVFGNKPPEWTEASTKVLDWLLDELKKPVPDDYTECFMRALLREIHPMMVPGVVDALKNKMAKMSEHEITSLITHYALDADQAQVVVAQLRAWLATYEARRATKQ